MATGFHIPELTDGVTVSAVGPHSARLWIRTVRPGRCRVRWRAEENDADAGEVTETVPDDSRFDNTHRFRIPPPGHQLRPLTRYRYSITSVEDGRTIGEGGFETMPADRSAAPSSFSFAIASCNQPFDAKGRVRPDSREMLRATKTVLEQHDCKFLILMGDQMYSDMPLDLSLFDEDYFARVAPEGRERLLDCTADEVRALFQARYRTFCGLPELRAILSSIPTYTIVDDHDIVDNWGSDPAHRTAEWRALGEGARWSYYDYQAGHLESKPERLPKSFHYEITYGHTSIFVTDLRSGRWVESDGGELISKEQWADLDAFIANRQEQKALFIVMSVPPVHLPRFLSETIARISPSGEDFSDRWSSLAHVDDRDRVLKGLHRHQIENPNQRLVILAGDIHVGCAHEIRWHRETRSVHQLISSGLTNRVSKPIRIGARLLMRLNRSVATRDGELKADVRSLRGIAGRRKNPYADLNVGVVRVGTDGPAGAASVEYLLYGHEGDRPVCVYQSPKL